MRTLTALAALYTLTLITVHTTNPEILDTVPALILALTITAIGTAGFTAGALLTVLTQIIIPTRHHRNHP